MKIFKMAALAIAALCASCGSSDQAPTPDVSVTVSAAQVRVGESITVRWQSTNAQACEGADRLSGEMAESGSLEKRVDRDGQWRFTVICKGPGGSTKQTAVAMAVNIESWPTPSISAADIATIKDQLEGTSGSYHDTSYVSYLQQYSPTGDYLNWGVWRRFFDDGEVVMTPEGLPQVKDGNTTYWNTVTLCHFALTMHGRILHGDTAARANFNLAVEKLLTLQRADGGFPYPSRQHRQTVLKDGWVSAMAQGNALSVFARAFELSKDDRYLKAGERALQNLLTPVAQGGAFATLEDLNPSLYGYSFFPEYPASPIDFTLNGYMYALLGVYDWAKASAPSSARAQQAFDGGIKTLVAILPLFDADRFSTYDLAHIVLKTPPYVAPVYLGIHVYLLHALNSVNPNSVLLHYEERWRGKIDELNQLVKFTKIQTNVQSPQPARSSITINLEAEGGNGSKKLYRVAVKFNNEWTDLGPYSESSKITWTPQQPGDYDLGFFVKEADSSQPWDNFRYIKFQIN